MAAIDVWVGSRMMRMFRHYTVPTLLLSGFVREFEGTSLRGRKHMSQPVSLPEQRTLVVDSEHAEEYLAPLGIAVSALLRAVTDGEARAAAVTGPEYPRTAAGLERWIHTVGALRRWFLRQDWMIQDPNNRPICVAPDLTVRLAVMSGDAATGIAESEEGPRALHVKGAATESAINQMALQLRADLLRLPEGYKLSDPPPAGDWVLVYYRGVGGVQMELSLPSGMKDGQVTGWAVRVILDQYVPDQGIQAPADIGGGDVTFDVTEAS